MLLPIRDKEGEAVGVAVREAEIEIDGEEVGEELFRGEPLEVREGVENALEDGDLERTSEEVPEGVN